MSFFSLLKRSMRIPFRVSRFLYVQMQVLFLRFVNRFGRRSVTDDSGPVVSLTTYGVRTQSVHLAIESIARGKQLPSRLILWLDDVSSFDALPIGLRRLQKRGLEVKFCKNYGPHKKYYPYLESGDTLDVPMVTADDDVLYPSFWLKELSEAFQRFPDVVNCHRARLVELHQESIENYGCWHFSNSTKPSFRNFAIGVGGVIYPPLLQQRLKREGNAFERCCPKADDIWLHLQAIRAGYKVRQIRNRPFRLSYIPGTQSNALHHHNLAGGENDRQIELTYHRKDIDLLRECS